MYLNDILVFSLILEDHLQHLDTIFDRLRKHDLKLKLKKCNFLKSETNYLGFIIGNDRFKLGPIKSAGCRISLNSDLC